MIKRIAVLSLLSLVCSLAFSSKANAQDWVRINIKDSKSYVYLDHDSIKRNEKTLFYVVRFKDEKGVEKLVFVKSDTSEDIIGIIKTKDYDSKAYVTPKSWKGAHAFMKKVDDDSFLKQVNIFAQNETALQQAMAARQLRRQSLDTAKEEAYKKFDLKYPGMREYVSSVEKQVKANWKPPIEHEKLVTKIKFKVSREGKLVSTEIIQSSSDKKYDEKALEAVNKTAPFKPFPETADSKWDGINIIITFDYYVVDVNKK